MEQLAQMRLKTGGPLTDCYCGSDKADVNTERQQHMSLGSKVKVMLSLFKYTCMAVCHVR